MRVGGWQDHFDHDFFPQLHFFSSISLVMWMYLVIWDVPEWYFFLEFTVGCLMRPAATSENIARLHRPASPQGALKTVSACWPYPCCRCMPLARTIELCSCWFLLMWCWSLISAMYNSYDIAIDEECRTLFEFGLDLDQIHVVMLHCELLKIIFFVGLIWLMYSRAPWLVYHSSFSQTRLIINDVSFWWIIT